MGLPDVSALSKGLFGAFVGYISAELFVYLDSLNMFIKALPKDHPVHALCGTELQKATEHLTLTLAYLKDAKERVK